MNANEMNDRIIQALNNQLIQKNVEFEELLARVAHELLTPITSILICSDEIKTHYEELSKEEMYTKEELMMFVVQIQKAGEDLKNQVGEILNHFSPNQIVSKPSILNIRSLIQGLLDQFSTDLSQASIAVEFYCDKSTTFFATETSLKTILRNLISNAVKFTVANKSNPNKKISIRVEEDRTKLKISIKDTGIGMSSDFYDSGAIYSLGKRDANAKKNQVKGYGLGMSTTHELVRTLSGELKYESELSKGTLVEVSFYKEEEELVI